MIKHACIRVTIQRGLRRNTPRPIVAKSLYGLKERHLVPTCATCRFGSSHSSLLVRGVHTRASDDIQEVSIHNIDCQEENASIPGSSTDAGSSSQEKVHVKARIDRRSRSSDLQAPVFEKETFEGWMIEVQEAMGQGNPPLKEVRRRAKAWKVGKMRREMEDENDDEKECKEVNSVKERGWSMKGKKTDAFASRSDAGAGERRTDGTRDEASSTTETREDASRPNPYSNYLLPVYSPLKCGYRRLADLSFIEADARLGLFTELYNSPIPWRRRGGRGELTKKWDDILAARRWEKTTGERATWVRSDVERQQMELRRKELQTRNREDQRTKKGEKKDEEGEELADVCYGA